VTPAVPRSGAASMDDEGGLVAGRFGWALDHHVKDAVERELVKAAEENGFESIWTMENHHLRDGVTTAAVTLERTRRLPVIMGTLSPFFRHPIEIGLTLANLERMYPGRTGLNLGVGMQETLTRIGVSGHDKPMKPLREAVEIIKLLFAGEKFKYEGTRFKIEKHHLSGEKLRTPDIFFSVMGPKLIALAGEVAEGVNLPLASSPEYTAQSVEQFEEGSRRGGRDRGTQTIVTEVLVQVGDDDDDISGVRRLLGFHYASEYFRKVVAPSGVDVPHDEIREAFIKREMDRVDSLITDEMVETFTAVGSADAIVRRLRDYEAAGADMILLYTAGAEEARVRTINELGAAIRRAGALEEAAT
jgi:5,10-methylenetetrahydromethanopterin reductase